MIQIEAARHDVASIRVRFHVVPGFVFVPNLADNLFDHIFHRDQAAVLPYSSTTTAMCAPSPCISRSRS